LAFTDFQRRFPQIGDVRGLGAMIAMEFVDDPETKVPTPGMASRIVEEARARGLLLLKAGLHGNVIRVLVPLVATDQDIDMALHALESSLEAILHNVNVSTST
jgi:4-aminobutyrate aminotransferase/(S)-3-amino-2-methylpropionate transaminase